MQHDHLVSFSDFADSKGYNRQRTIEKRDFEIKVNAALAKKKKKKDGVSEKYRQKEEKIAALDAIVKEGTEKWDSSQYMRIFSAYRDLQAFSRMIDLYGKSDNLDFQQAPMVREQLAVAYRKVPRTDDNASEAEKNQAKIGDYYHSMDICFGLIDEGYGNGVSFGNIGRCMRYLTNGIDDKNATEFEKNRKMELLKDSATRMENGFLATTETSVGVQAVHANLLLGRNERAQKTAEVVYLAALRDGAEEANDYFSLSFALQAACAAGKDEKTIGNLYSRLEASFQYSWEVKDIIRDMERIDKALPSKETKNVCNKLKEFEKKNLAAFEKEKRKVKADDALIVKGQEVEVEGQDKKLVALKQHSYSYRGCGSVFRGTNRVGGNMAFGGQLPDHAVSRKDLRLFAGLIEKSPLELGIQFNADSEIDKKLAPVADKPLSDIKDPELFMRLSDKFIRQTFTTENFAGSGLHMEANALSKDKHGESVYDASVKSFIRASGKTVNEHNPVKDPNIDTRTNISAIFALGMGDCRHHAQVKQIMFDMWQKIQMDTCLSTMYRDVWKGVPIQNQEQKEDRFYDILGTELRTADVEVRTPVKMVQRQQQKEIEGKWIDCFDEKGNPIMEDTPYKPEMDKNGKFIVDETKETHNLEDHTLCWLIKKDRQGNLESFGLRDAFYQNEYDWGSKNIDAKNIDFDKEGKLRIRVGEMSGGKTSTGKAVPIYQQPTKYNTGKRDQAISNSIGRDVCFVGVPMKGFATPNDFLGMIKDRSKMAFIIQKTYLKDSDAKSRQTWIKESLRKEHDVSMLLAKKVGLHSAIGQCANKNKADEAAKYKAVQSKLSDQKGR